MDKKARIFTIILVPIGTTIGVVVGQYLRDPSLVTIPRLLSYYIISLIIIVCFLIKLTNKDKKNAHKSQAKT